MTYYFHTDVHCTYLTGGEEERDCFTTMNHDVYKMRPAVVVVVVVFVQFDNDMISQKVPSKPSGQ